MESLDILYLTLSVCLGMLTILISVSLIYFMSILRDVVKVVDGAKEIVEKINTYIAKPILMTKQLFEMLGPVIGAVEERLSASKKKGK